MWTRSYVSTATASSYPVWWGVEPPPTFGVREPREPSPSTLSGGAAASLHFTDDPEAAAVAEGARVDVV